MTMRRTAVRVLVVEEFAAERLLLVNRLRDLGVEEVLATGGLQTALDLARGPSAVDVVLCTIKGPDLQALELIRRLGEHAVDASLVLELTEDALVTDLSVAMQVLDRLGEAGFHLAMDDFGTGYLTLSLLGALPLTELKVDRSLIQGVADDWRRQAMVDSVLRLCQRLGLRSVAEGVETHEDLAVLRDLGCDIAQGWLFAPAMSWADFADFVERDEPRLVTGPAAVARGSIGA